MHFSRKCGAWRVPVIDVTSRRLLLLSFLCRCILRTWTLPIKDYTFANTKSSIENDHVITEKNYRFAINRVILSRTYPIAEARFASGCNCDSMLNKSAALSGNPLPATVIKIPQKSQQFWAILSNFEYFEQFWTILNNLEQFRGILKHTLKLKTSAYNLEVKFSTTLEFWKNFVGLNIKETDLFRIVSREPRFLPIIQWNLFFQIWMF